MQIRALVESGTSVNPSNVYLFINNHGLIDCLKRRKGQRKKNKASTGKSKFWMRKLSLGQIEFEELGRDLSSKISDEDLKLLFNCLLMGPQYLKRRAFTILSFLHGISAGDISKFYFIPRPTVLHHLSLYAIRGCRARNSFTSLRPWMEARSHKRTRGPRRCFNKSFKKARPSNPFKFRFRIWIKEPAVSSAERRPENYSQKFCPCGSGDTTGASFQREFKMARILWAIEGSRFIRQE